MIATFEKLWKYQVKETIDFFRCRSINDVGIIAQFV